MNKIVEFVIKINNEKEFNRVVNFDYYKGLSTYERDFGSGFSYIDNTRDFAIRTTKPKNTINKMIKKPKKSRLFCLLISVKIFNENYELETMVYEK